MRTAMKQKSILAWTPAMEEVVVEDVTSNNGNDNDESIGNKMTSKVLDTVDLSKESHPLSPSPKNSYLSARF